MRTFIFLFIFMSYMVLAPILLLPYLAFRPFSRVKAKSYVAWILSGTMKFILRVVGVRLHVKGFENFPKDTREPVLLIANHQSSWDIAVLLTVATRPIGFVAKKEIAYFPPLYLWMKALGCLFIDRKSPRSALKTMAKGEEDLKKGNMVAIFPEGTRSRGGDMLEFKRGSFKMALRTGASILPVTISGSYKSWEEKGNSIQPANIYLTFHPLIPVKGVSEEELDALPNKTWNVIHDELETLKKLPEDPRARIKGGVSYE